MAVTLLALLEAAGGKRGGPSQSSPSLFFFTCSFFHLRGRSESWGSPLEVQSCSVQPPLLPTYSIPLFLAGQSSVLLSIPSFKPGQSLPA